jgi:cytochrome c-type biogenesis protein CcmH/NrfG
VNRKEAAERIAALRDAARARPGDFDAQYALAEAVYEHGDFEDAIVELREAARLNPNDPESRMWIGQILFAWGDHAAAIEILLEAVRLEPDHGPCRYLLGRVYGMVPDREGVEAQARELDRLGKRDWAAAIRGMLAGGS